MFSNIPIQVSLQNLNQFESFYPHLLEQRIHSAPRIFNPIPIFEFCGLEESSEYQLSLRFDRISNNKFQYKNQEWIVVSKNREFPPVPSPSHSFLRKTGKQLMSSGIELSVKLSTNPELKNAVALKPLFKYQAVLVVSKIVNGGKSLEMEQEFKFDCLKFMAVTKYYNRQISSQKSMLTNRGIANSRRIGKPSTKSSSSTPESVPISTTSKGPLKPLSVNIPEDIQFEPMHVGLLKMNPPPMAPAHSHWMPVESFYGYQPYFFYSNPYYPHNYDSQFQNYYCPPSSTPNF